MHTSHPLRKWEIQPAVLVAAKSRQGFLESKLLASARAIPQHPKSDRDITLKYIRPAKTHLYPSERH